MPMLNSKPAQTQHPIHALIANRWSPVGLDTTQPVELEKLNSILEAGRWAPSSYNAQPWSYVVGIKGEEIHKLLADCIVEGNSWAKEAGVLVLSIAKKTFEHNGKPNRHYLHDVGAASVSMALEAAQQGLVFHQMAGFDMEKAVKEFKISDDYEPGSMIAIGYEQNDLSKLPPQLKERDNADRQRKPFSDMYYK